MQKSMENTVDTHGMHLAGTDVSILSNFFPSRLMSFSASGPSVLEGVAVAGEVGGGGESWGGRGKHVGEAQLYASKPKSIFDCQEGQL